MTSFHLPGPQLVLSVYGPDVFGNDVVRGYGVTHIPFTPGQYVSPISTSAFTSSSQIQASIFYFFGSSAVK